MDFFVLRPGVKIAVKDGLFHISWFDEHQQRQEETQTPLGLRTMYVGETAVISVPAMALATEYRIDLLFLDFHSMPFGRLEGFELQTTPSVQKAQTLVSVSRHAVDFVKAWTAKKLLNQAEFLEKLKARRDDQKGQLLQKAADEIKKHRKQLLALHGQRVREIAERLRGLEGIAATVYFKALSDVLQENYRFAGRSQHPAVDPFNAFLNYGFAILYSKTEAALRLAGIHPQIGFLHRDDYKRKSMLYDFIEPFRVYVERVVFQLFSKKMVGANHTTATGNGVHLGKEGIQLLVERLNAFMDEKKEVWNEQNVSRDRFVKLSAVHTAKRFLELGDAETVEILMEEFAN